MSNQPPSSDNCDDDSQKILDDLQKVISAQKPGIGIESIKISDLIMLIKSQSTISEHELILTKRNN